MIAAGTMKEKVETSTYLPSQGKPKIKNSKDLFKHLKRRIDKNEEVLLMQELKEFGLDKNDIVKFFSKEAVFIICWALISSPTSGPLNFLFKTFPEEIKNALVQNKDFVGDLLKKETTAEELGWYDDSRKQTQIEKFSLLLQIDSTLVKQQVEIVNSQISQNVKGNLVIAIKTMLEKDSKPVTSINN
jgi:hypothetical protein